MIKKQKGLEGERTTEFSQNVLKLQNQMLNTYLDMSKRQLYQTNLQLNKYINQNANLKYTLSIINQILLKNQHPLEDIQQTINTSITNINLPQESYSQLFEIKLETNGNLHSNMETEDLEKVPTQHELELPPILQYFKQEKFSELQDRIGHLEKENQVQSRRIRTLCTYNNALIENNIETLKQLNGEIKDVKFDCLCGSAQMQELQEQLIYGFENGYNKFIRSAFPTSEEIIHQQEKNTEMQLEQEDKQKQPSEPKDLEYKSDNFKQIFDNLISEKSILLKQIEDLKISNKIIEDQFFESPIYEQLYIHNKELVDILKIQENYIAQLESQLHEEVKKNIEIQTTKEEDRKQNITQDKFQYQKTIDNNYMSELFNKFEVQQNLINNDKLKYLEKNEESMKIEIHQQRQKIKDLLQQLEQEISKKEELNLQVNNLKSELNGLKAGQTNQRMEFITFRYEKFKQILQEIETEYATVKGQDYLVRFRELVGYIKMRDEKVKGLENQIELKQQDLVNLKKQMQSIFEELDYNEQAYAIQFDKNNTLSKLLEETQKNEARSIQERISEKHKLEQEKQELQIKQQQNESIIKQMQLFIEQSKTQNKNSVSEISRLRESITQIKKENAEHKIDLLHLQNEQTLLQEQLRILQEKNKLGEIINLKYIKAAEKSKSKQKILKQQIKSSSTQNNDSESELVQSLKMMVNCQQCKKKLKEQIILKCLHMFCKSCLEENLKNRNRACPICRARYGVEDVKQIKFA